LKTANSGYLTRRLVDVAQDCIIVQEDCGTKKGISKRAVIEGGEVLASLEELVAGRSAAKAITDGDKKTIVKAGHIIDEEAVERMENAGVETVVIRSVLTCEAKVGACASCYGRDLARGTRVNVGEAVGVIAAQSIGEPGTQLTMRTFHIGGAVQRGTVQSSVEAAYDAVIELRNCSTVKNTDGIQIVMTRNTELALVDDQGRERARHRIPYGAKLLVKKKAKVKRGDRMAEWDPYTLPIITEKEGVVHYMDMVENVSMVERLDDATGIASKVVIDWRQHPKGTELKPRITLRNKRSQVLTLANGLEARYFLSVDSVLSVEHGQTIHAGDVLARIPRESAKTRDITGGLPRVAELFEARKPKDYAVISEIDGRVEFGKDYKSKRRIVVVPPSDKDEPREYLIPKGKHISVQEGDFVEVGDSLMDGNPVPHDILRVLGVEALADYLIDEIQDVYRLQGVKINDKHIEVIVKQMLQKVEVTNGGDTTYLIGELVDRLEFDAANESTVADGGKAADSMPVLQGITKASLQTQSFISAASFQETTRVLTEAAVSGKVDNLVGLKENVIVGHLIPAGTGSVMNRVREIAADRDNQLASIAAEASAAIEAAEVVEESVTPEKEVVTSDAK
jgi:DNA-directed RNA polymerase subunit beta'